MKKQNGQQAHSVHSRTTNGGVSAFALLGVLALLLSGCDLSGGASGTPAVRHLALATQMPTAVGVGNLPPTSTPVPPMSAPPFSLLNHVLLNSIEMVSANEGWAVGDIGALLHYSGGSWTTVSRSPDA